MSILVCTPCYGGQATVPYLQSCLRLQENAISSKIPIGFLHLMNESLITRARNTCVFEFLNSGFERLLFIDADIEFTPEDVIKLWNIDEPVVCGTYPVKSEERPLSAWKDGMPIQDQEGVIDVDYAATGFMMIKREVFEKLEPVSDGYEQMGYSIDEYFTTGSHEKIYESEGYNFCRRWREYGSILVDMSIKLSHWGFYKFEAKQ